MSKSSRSVCALVSGGMESAVLLARLLQRHSGVLPLYLRCGFVWEPAELFWLRRLLGAMRSSRLSPLRVVEAPLRSAYGPHWSLTRRGIPGAGSPDAAVFLPGRNILLLSHAAIVCVRARIRTLALGVLAGNPFGDASPGFFRDLAELLSRALGIRFAILAPLRGAAKARLIREAAGAPLALTFSCLAPRGMRHCGACNKCAERRRAFRDAGVFDPTSYVLASVVN
jgi:7-cyano-7-deazaguanine synthase